MTQSQRSLSSVDLKRTFVSEELINNNISMFYMLHLFFTSIHLAFHANSESDFLVVSHLGWTLPSLQNQNRVSGPSLLTHTRSLVPVFGVALDTGEETKK